MIKCVILTSFFMLLIYTFFTTCQGFFIKYNFMLAYDPPLNAPYIMLRKCTKDSC